MTANYASSDPSERLQAVRESIARALVAQEYETGNRGRRQRMAELKQLRDLEKDLMQEVEDSSNSSASLAQFTPES